MTMNHPPLPPDADPAPGAPARAWTRWRRAWAGSLRFRLLAMGLMPLLVAFPLVMAVLAVVGGERADTLLQANLRASLAGGQSYLNQVRTDAGQRVLQLAKSDRLIQRLRKGAHPIDLHEALRTAAESSGLDVLLVVEADGRVIGSSATVDVGQRLRDSHVLRQARIGVANAAFERLPADALADHSPAFPDRARVDGAPGDGLLVHAAAHFPLAVDTPDAVLVGGILINRNGALIDHLRELLYPVGSLPGQVEGLTAVLLDDVSITTSRQRLQGHAPLGQRAPAPAVDAVLRNGQTWVGEVTLAGESHMLGLAPLVDGEGHRIGMLAAGFPDGPYRRVIWLLLGIVAALMALTLLAISVVFVRSGNDLTQRLSRIVDTMTAVRQGDRHARVGRPDRPDELGQLALHFDELLETLAAQDAAQRAAQQTIADEASRRRALFEHERDGVVILHADGRVFEANPRGAAMLGYHPDALLHTRVDDWDPQLGGGRLAALLDGVGPEGRMLETVHRRRDGRRYDAEVSISRAAWGDQTFVLLLMRDITERKAVEAELARYRQELEQLVVQRTQQLGERTEQLDAVFALSPDGFVSFDRQHRVAFANRAFLQMTGLSADEAVGLPEPALTAWLRARSSAQAPFPGLAPLRLAQQAAAGGGSSPDTAAAEGRQVFELTAPQRRVLQVALRLSEAEGVSQVLYLRDVTHESEVDRMKSEFLTTAAHELRTPMTSIYGFANLLRAREMSAERRRDVLDTIAQQSELMIGIVNQLLDLARIEARRGQDFERERMPLADIVAATVAGYSPPAGRQPPVVGPFDPGLQVDADRNKMHQALLNVVSNAYKYSPGGGTVTVSCRQGLHEGRPRVGIEVRDQGIGMTPEQLAHCCERFYRADASGSIPGTGLGMAIVSEIIGLHGGELELASTPGEGTTITLWLPQAGLPAEVEVEVDTMPA